MISVVLTREEWDFVASCIASTQQNFTINEEESRKYWTLLDKIHEQTEEPLTRSSDLPIEP